MLPLARIEDDAGFRTIPMLGSSRSKCCPLLPREVNTLVECVHLDVRYAEVVLEVCSCQQEALRQLSNLLYHVQTINA